MSRADGNLVDTSNVYGDGASAELLGRWFANRPTDVTERVVLATKGRFGTGPDAYDNGSSHRNLDRALSASLRRLGRDNVDLYQLHGRDPLTPIEETLTFLDDAVHAGKVNYIGLSNVIGWQLQLALSTAKGLGFQVPVTLQPQYSQYPARSSTRSYQLPFTTTSACCPGRRWPAGSSAANTAEVIRPGTTPARARATRCSTVSSPASLPRSRTGPRSTPSGRSRPSTTSPQPRLPTAGSRTVVY